MTVDDALTWHVAMTEVRGERGAQLALRDAGYATLWLHYPATVKHARRVIGVLRPLFPGYLFFGREEAQAVRPAKEARGVTGLIEAGDGPYVLPPAVLADLRSRCDADGRVGMPRDRHDDGRPRLPVGAEVNIVDGPLKGMPGTVASDDGGYVMVTVCMFARPTTAPVPASALKVVG